jgi:hypothetical protein
MEGIIIFSSVQETHKDEKLGRILREGFSSLINSTPPKIFLPVKTINPSMSFPARRASLRASC